MFIRFRFTDCLTTRYAKCVFEISIEQEYLNGQYVIEISTEIDEQLHNIKLFTINVHAFFRARDNIRIQSNFKFSSKSLIAVE